MPDKLKLLLAHTWDGEQDIVGWWASEKLDGVRAYWDGSRLLSRLGNQFFAPAWFTKGFPKVPLDGELWIGRKLFNQTVGAVKRHDGSELWRPIRYMVFDAPTVDGPFEERLHEASRLTLKAPHAKLHKHQVVTSMVTFRHSLGEVWNVGGEGMMLREPGSLYVRKRSKTLLKCKQLLTQDGVVIGHEPGKGKHKGRLGALVVSLRSLSAVAKQMSPPVIKLMQSDPSVNVGTGFTDYQRENPPKIGSVVAYSFQELTPAGIPRFPAYIGQRIVS